MRFETWINRIIDSGDLCSSYAMKALSAKSRKQFMDIVLDSNGIRYLPLMSHRGFPLPYETICEEFGNYINGKYIRSEKCEVNGTDITSALYCCHSGDVDINNDLTCFMGCYCRIVVSDFLCHVVTSDKNSIIEVENNKGGKLMIEYYDNIELSFVDELSRKNTKVIKLKDDE